MQLAIMQPYFLPYIGYFQLMNAVDQFVIYDNIEYTKKGWINRNRILANGKDEYMTIPLKSDSDFLCVNQRMLAHSYPDDATKILRKIEASYSKAPFYKDASEVLAQVLTSSERNLFGFILNSIKTINTYLNIDTKLVISSDITINHELKGAEKVIAICKKLQAKHYLNPIGGLDLYNKEKFKTEGIELAFLKSNATSYAQYGNAFIPWLSIIDVMMFCPVHQIKEMLLQYELL
ncbi:WbqC family protein [Pedobacter sp. KR3-3]|uniref:WbqC family protein n=1 Tax=Pedobacter albus TaxID=3113905 RepID=A0ABU7I7B7_9SPHI|nr:WbqC family protein [Pedobacter sp. KR3-3]MEE1945129.1 WbqC family protein [Pedobacter sp. KR3-3]